MTDAATLLRQARRRHAVDQRTLAQRAGTSQTQVSRIERGVVSPSVSTLRRLLEALGEELELIAVARGAGARSSPDQAAERRRDLEATTPAERVLDAIRLSRSATRIAAAGAAARDGER